MSMQPSGPTEVPAAMVRVARAAFPKGSLAIRVRDELRPLFTDEEFADSFPSRGKPAWSPGRLALVLLTTTGRARTDSTHVLSASRDLSWLLSENTATAPPSTAPKAHPARVPPRRPRIREQ